MPPPVITYSGDRYRTLGATDVFFVILNGQQHSAHFSKEEADSVAFDLSVEHNYEGHPEECGYSEISVLSFVEMMESPVEMVI
tara:strand:- start:117 stop:365 length:249 start_codon:yes stop_codon:yes gene_type:complete